MEKLHPCHAMQQNSSQNTRTGWCMGTDMGTSERMYLETFRILETADEHFYTDHSYHWPLYGLNLPKEVLEKLYRLNAEKIMNQK
ncbi:MAG: hypothetical protein ACTHM7_11800 [Ginsengibacter sp.]